MKTLLKSVALFLVVLMIGAAFIACGKKDNNDTNKPGGETVASDAEAGFNVAPANWGKEFNVIAPHWACYARFFFDKGDERDTSSPIDMALYARTERIKSHLGVTLKQNIVGTPNNGQNLTDAFNILKQTVSSGDDTYQLAQTHTFINTSAMATQGYTYDFRQLTDINLDAKYWNKEAMEELEMNAALYYGLSDYMIADPNAVFFNKTMQENYKIRNPYEMVRDGTWTLENMTVESMKVSEQGDKATKPLGFCTIGEWHFMSFIDSCDTNIVLDEGGYKTLNMGADNERYANVYDQLEDLCTADSTLLYKPAEHDVHDPDKSIASGRVLFSLVALHQANEYRKTEVKFGILPYPKYDADQKEYRSFDWSGLMCVPLTIQNPQMVGQVLECLSYFSSNGENDLHTAYYENLLGSKLAEAPDDYEMLKIIYGGIVTNAAINMCEGAPNASSSEGLRYLINSYTRMAGQYKVNSPTVSQDSLAAQWASHGSLAQKALDNTVNS
ncbi:MAG: hypothetical protein IKJ00_09005 [Clostridia bacterium]|nr:hypothetical protein [Clostridia bacterium]